MPLGDDTDPTDHPPQALQPSDDFLMAGMIAGDTAALRKLMDRYDRLIRYTVFGMTRDRCAKDPQWLDSIAGDTWSGFVQSVRRAPDSRPSSLKAYLVRTARNRCISALRKRDQGPTLSLDDEDGHPEVEAESADPAEILGRWEDLDALRGCLAQLDPDERAMAAQLSAIVDRKWRAAAEALGVPESTVRSRWKLTLEKLRRCLRSKTGKSFAPPDSGSDQ